MNFVKYLKIKFHDILEHYDIVIVQLSYICFNKKKLSCTVPMFCINLILTSRFEYLKLTIKT